MDGIFYLCILMYAGLQKFRYNMFSKAVHEKMAQTIKFIVYMNDNNELKKKLMQK